MAHARLIRLHTLCNFAMALCLVLLAATLFACQPKSGDEDLYGASTYDFGSQANGQEAGPGHAPGAPHAAKQTAAAQNGELVIPARSKAEWIAKGNCLDPDRPAPREGDNFRLVPINTLIYPELLALYEGFINLTPHDADARRYQQQIVWAMRTVDKRNSYASSLGARQKALLDKSLPGGAILFDDVRLQKAGEEGVADFLVGLLPRISFFGFSINPSDLLNPDRAPDVADNQLAQLITMPVEGGAAGGAAGTKSLDAGIETRITGTAPLTMQVSIINTTDRDYVFVPAHYAAEAQRKVQRLTLAPPQDARISGI